jgi:hypothetical protein
MRANCDLEVITRQCSSCAEFFCLRCGQPALDTVASDNDLMSRGTPRYRKVCLKIPGNSPLRERHFLACFGAHVNNT